MKFTIKREVILKLLQIVSGVVERRQTLPILSNVLMDVSPRGLTITATDLEVEIVVETDLGTLDGGKTTLPARKFLDICRALPEGAELDVAVEKNRAMLRSGKSRFVLSTLPPTEFPNIDEIRPVFSFDIEQAKLKRLIDKTFFSMAHQDVRYYLNGLLLEVRGDSLRAVATDGHRLAFSQTPVAIELEEAYSVIIPRKGITELQKLLADVDELVNVQVATNHLRLQAPGLKFTSKLIDGRFPDYQRVIPQNADKLVISKRDALRQAVQRTSILTNEKYRSVRLQLEPGILRVWAHNPEQEEAEEELAVDYVGSSIEIGFNSIYLLDALAAVNGEEIELRLSDSNSCCLIEAVGDTKSKYVVMPMRL